MEHPVGLPLCWCRDRGVCRDTRRGLLSRRFSPRDRVAVVAPFPIAMVSRRPRGTRQYLCCLGCFRGSGWGVGVCPRAGLPLGPLGGERDRLPGCVQ
ncbi:hypothetical protein Taro_001861 [Colocasia esculenta]|uniref:Uncharacterized protein n=1 Tax=Colocasia esculenta TaxID=4460 RepID=A0A843TM18_COLES|nr:hypothetical protein [Colocasia esculenta]